MATISTGTMDAEPVAPSGNHTLSYDNIGLGPTQSVTGPDAEQAAAAVNESLPHSRENHPLGDRSAVAAVNESLPHSREGRGGIDAQAVANVPASDHALRASYSNIGLGPTQSVSGPDAEQAAPAAFIPSAYFRRLRGRVVNEDGEPITDATHIYTLENLPTGGTVNDDGTFTLFLLRQNYSDFLLVASSGREDVDYTWYSYDGRAIDPLEQDVTLVFKETRMKGLFGGTGVDFGGQLG